MPLRDRYYKYVYLLVGLAIVAAVVFLAARWNRELAVPPNSCIIAPPKDTQGDRSAAIKVAADLTALANQPAKIDVGADLKNRVKQTFQVIPDNDIACQMLLQTVTCLSDKPNSQKTVEALVRYIQEEKRCGGKETAHAPAPKLPSVLVLDSHTRDFALGDVVRALDPLERNRLAKITPAVISADESIRDRLGSMRPDVVVAHLHAYRQVSLDDPKAEEQLLILFRSFNENNPAVRYIVYSRSFTVAPREADKWLKQVADATPALVGRMQTVPLPDISPLPEPAREALRKLVTAALQTPN